jgi:hypothetical protein
MANTRFHPTFHPTFLSTNYAQEMSLTGSLVGSLTIVRSILAHSFHSPVKTRISFGLDRPVRHVRSMLRTIKRKEEKKLMGLYIIMHIFEISAKNQYEATDELMLARQNHFDKVFLKKVIVKDAEPKLPREKVNVFETKKPAKWGTIFKRQLTGNW